MQASKRKMLRTKREQSLMAENENRQLLNSLILHINTNVASEIVTLQKLVLALRQVLVERRLVSEVDISSALASIEQYEDMKKKGLILGEKKNE